MTYIEYCEERQKAINSLPIFWAFSKKQFEEAMQARDLTTSTEDLKKIYEIAPGGYCLKSDYQKIVESFHEDQRKIKALMEDPVFAKEAFREELANHEYLYTYDDREILSCFFDLKDHLEDEAHGDYISYPDYLKEIGCEYLIPIYAEARREYLSSVEA